MRKFSMKKAVAVGAGAVIVASGAGVAFAYWTESGTGSGTASTGTTHGITVNQTSTITGMYPGGPAQALAGTFTNTNPSKVYVNTVTVSIAKTWSAQSDSSKPACTYNDFIVVQPGVVGAEVASGTGVGSWSGASIALNDAENNQDNCKGVDVPLTYVSN